MEIICYGCALNRRYATVWLSHTIPGVETPG